MVANLLDTRKEVVHIVHAATPALATQPESQDSKAKPSPCSTLELPLSSDREARAYDGPTSPGMDIAAAQQVMTIRRTPSEQFIEAPLVTKLVEMHAMYRAQQTR